MNRVQALNVLESVVGRFLGPKDQPESVQDLDFAKAYEALNVLRGLVDDPIKKGTSDSLDPRDLYIGTVAVFARSGGWVSHRDDGVYAENMPNGAVAVAIGGSSHSNRLMAVEALRTLNQKGPQGLLEPRFKDHEIARTVNSIVEIATEYASHQSLRERIAEVLRKALK